MKLKELGEFGFIDRIKVDALVRLYQGLVGIGDDCALFKVSPGMTALLTTDMLIERVHFLREVMTPYQIGYKSLAVNLSDIAAAGGIPKEAFVSIAVPESVNVEDLEGIYKGMKDLGRQFEVNITGGDTTGSFQDLVINIALTGEVEEDLALFRSGAKEGDLICVTGNLGDSAAGLDIILKHVDQKDNYPELLNQHFMPYPHVWQGRLIAKSKLAHAMMDISDGLASDIRHICRASDLGAVIFESSLPLSDSFRDYTSRFKPDYLKTAIGVGEDYNLLFTLAEDDFTALEKLMHGEGYQLFCVGKMTKEQRLILEDNQGQSMPLQIGGWDHFKEKNL
jgi:thiamine-monophosphate kinase